MAKAEKRWTGGEVLAALPGAGECMLLDVLVAKTGLPRERVTRLITALNSNGSVSMVRKGCYRRTPTGDAMLQAGRTKSGPKGPHGHLRTIGGLSEKLWRALRIRRRATVPELLDVIDHELADAPAQAQRYFAHLRRAGITGSPARRIPGETDTSNGFKQHVLLVDLGPKAPIWRQQAKRLWDPNHDRWADETVAEARRG